MKRPSVDEIAEAFANLIPANHTDPHRHCGSCLRNFAHKAVDLLPGMTDAEAELVEAAMAWEKRFPVETWRSGYDAHTLAEAAAKVRAERSKPSIAGTTWILPQAFRDGDRFIVRINKDTGMYELVPTP